MRTARMLAALAALSTALALSAGSAAADDGGGTAVFTVNDGTPCPDTSFAWDDMGADAGLPPVGGVTLSITDIAPTGACAVDVLASEGQVILYANGSAASVGGVRFVTSTWGVTCEYQASLLGSWSNPADAQTGYLVHLFGAATFVSGFPVLCPQTVSVDIGVQQFTIEV